MTKRKANPIKPQDIETPWRGKSPAVAAQHMRGGGNGRFEVRNSPRGAVVIETPAHVTVQQCPGYTHNHATQCGPGERPFGAGFAAVGIGRDVATGKGWWR